MPIGASRRCWCISAKSPGDRATPYRNGGSARLAGTVVSITLDSMSDVRVLIVDDQAPFREASRMVVEMTDGFEVAGKQPTARRRWTSPPNCDRISC